MFEVYTFAYEEKMNDIGGWSAKPLVVSFLDIDQGDATLIRAPGGQTILIDAGQSNSPILSEIGASLPFYKHHIDMIIATHPDADHIGGLPKVVERYSPEVLLESGVHANTYIDQSLQNIVSEKKIQVLRARKGMTIKFGAKDLKHIQLTLQILFPDRNVDDWISKTNDASIVARLSFGRTSFILTGDSPIDIEQHLAVTGALGHVDILKVGHHGSRTSTSEEFVKALTPSFAVISVGKKNRYGHPHQEVLRVLEKNKVKVLRTDEQGRITIESDGEKIIVD
ncbi:MAG: MBL fold metallo-hydrolase [Patescibacteria group bacterium]